MSKKSKLRKSKLRKRYPIIYKGKKWWRNLSVKDRRAFQIGFRKNEQASQIQKEEIEFNLKRAKSNLI